MPDPSNTSVLQNIPSTQLDETEPVILRAEVVQALKHLKEGKAAGYDSISAEELKQMENHAWTSYTKSVIRSGILSILLKTGERPS